MKLKVTLNGEKREVEAAEGTQSVVLPELLDDLGFGKIPVLVEHNGVALRLREHADTEVKEGDQLEIIRIVAGG